MKIYYWNEHEIALALNDLIGKEAFSEKDFNHTAKIRFDRMKDKRGDFLAVVVNGTKFRTKHSFKSHEQIRGREVLLIANMLGWEDCSMREAMDLAYTSEKHVPKLRPILNKVENGAVGY